MALRIKNQWFRDGALKSQAENASAVAFIVWRVTQNMVKHMREARFDIEVGVQYFDFMREVLMFLSAVVDRVAHARMTPEQRVEFTGALVVRLAEILEESQLEWLGPPAQGRESWRNQFIDAFNQVVQEYAEFGHDAQGPSFGFVRYLGSRIETVMPEKDRRWVIDQLMAHEVPEALEMVMRGFNGLYTIGERPRRRATMSGE